MLGSRQKIDGAEKEKEEAAVEGVDEWNSCSSLTLSACQWGRENKMVAAGDSGKEYLIPNGHT